MLPPPTPDDWQPAIVITPLPGESLGGLLMRHCEKNGWPSLAHFARSLGSTPSQIRWGNSAARLARAAGVDQTVLNKRTRDKRGVSARFYGHRLSLNHVDVDRRRICLDCLEGLRFLRDWFEINLFTVCPIHGKELVESCSCGKPLTWQDSRLDRCDDCDHRSPGGEQALREVPPFETWLGYRLGISEGAGAPHCLDSADIGLALRILENVGLLEKHGYSVYLPHVQSHADAEVIRLGFNALSDTAFEDLIARTTATFRKVSGMDVPKHAADSLGWFGNHVDNEDLPVTQPFMTRLLAALEQSVEFPVADLHQRKIVHISTFAKRLEVTLDEAETIVAQYSQGRVLRGPYLPQSVADDVRQAYLTDRTCYPS